MSIREALEILDQALQPYTINQLNRRDWFILHQAIETVKQYITAKETTNDTNSVDK